MMGDSPEPMEAGLGEVSDRGSKFAVRVSIDGAELPLKRFLHDMIGGAACGLLAELRGVGEARSIVIEVRKV